MSDVTDQYVTRAKKCSGSPICVHKVVTRTNAWPLGWSVRQRSFIAAARSLNEEDLHENLAYFKVPQAGIESIRSKLVFKIFDEYENIHPERYVQYEI